MSKDLFFLKSDITAWKQLWKFIRVDTKHRKRGCSLLVGSQWVVSKEPNFSLMIRKKHLAWKISIFQMDCCEKLRLWCQHNNVFKSEKICNFWKKNCIDDVVLEHCAENVCSLVNSHDAMVKINCVSVRVNLDL